MSILSEFCAFLDSDDWRYRVIEGKSIIKFGVQGHSANFDCWIDIDEERSIYLVYVIAPNRAPVTKRMEIAEFLTRANYGLVLGCFEMDMDDGEIRYRIGMKLESSQPSLTICRAAIYAPISTMEQYYKGFMAVIFADTTPEDAIAICEAREEVDEDEIKARLESLLEVSPDDLSGEEL